MAKLNRNPVTGIIRYPTTLWAWLSDSGQHAILLPQHPREVKPQPDDGHFAAEAVCYQGWYNVTGVALTRDPIAVALQATEVIP